ncbi:hypothetical protein BCIN_06g05620 [Botrytis cinerea B05.10]|uniref:Uncharacterized protein n=1 Tax=Botryotinia fuckeliana (strain B05.10) TaxID=332648 RepID=A0A384JKT3_BOTFB|nr:hypothetical protein BCIN_06g05620 [Botrytis cinerea B05.10]ATZ51130.1 hypothetical protein BCIN_06g05620 [Botrytis cinerea B05.10]
MCFKTFWGYTCGHCSLPCITKCPTTAQNENFPPCSIPALQNIPANQFCHACMRVSWNMSVIAEENAHRESHERGECNCEVIFDRAERERRERERGADLEARDFKREGDENARTRNRGRGRGRDATDANTAGAVDNTGYNNNGEGRERKGTQAEEIGGNAVVMQGSNMEAMMSTTPPGYRSPHPRDPASSHRYFHVANVHRGGPYDMNPVTGVVPAHPIDNPPIRTGSSPMYGDMMIIPPDPRMSNMGVYPPGHPILANHRVDTHAFHPFQMPPPPSSGPPSYQSPSFAPSAYSDGDGSTIYPGNQYSWSPNPEPNAPIPMPIRISERASTGGIDPRSYGQTGPPSQPRFQHHPTHVFSDPASYPMIYPQHQAMNNDAQRDTYNYAGYYMDRSHFNANTGANTSTHVSPQPRAQGPAPVPMAEHHTMGGFTRAPTFSPLSRGIPEARMVWHASDNSLPSLPPQVPYLGDSPLAAPAAPRYFNEGHHGARRNGRHGNGNTQRNTVQRARTSQSMGQLQMQMTTTTGPVQIDSQATQATTQATTQGQAQMHSQDTPAPMNISLLRTPRVISSMPRPNSTM